MAPPPYTTDTSPGAYAVQLACLRRMSGVEHFRRMSKLTKRVRKMAFGAIRRLHPEFDDQQVRLRFIELTYGKELIDAVAQHLNERASV